jgi:hypothetical protein
MVAATQRGVKHPRSRTDRPPQLTAHSNLPESEAIISLLSTVCQRPPIQAQKASSGDDFSDSNY